jgi:bifunctional non-homologous end joining protein LigD
LVHQIPTGAEWIHELKWDGYRLIARCESGVVYLWSCTGRNWATDFPSIGAAMSRLPVKSVILDGESVCRLEDGRPDFHALRSRHACQDARLIAYDLLDLDGEDLRRLPLHERRRRLQSLLSGNDVIRFSGHVEGGKGAALPGAFELNSSAAQLRPGATRTGSGL